MHSNLHKQTTKSNKKIKLQPKTPALPSSLLLQNYRHIASNPSSNSCCPFHACIRRMCPHSVVCVTIPRPIPAAVKSGMHQQYIEKLRHSQDYDESLHHPQPPPSMTSDVYLLACQPIYTPFSKVSFGIWKKMRWTYEVSVVKTKKITRKQEQWRPRPPETMIRRQQDCRFSRL